MHNTRVAGLVFSRDRHSSVLRGASAALKPLASGARVRADEWDELFIDARLRTRVLVVARRVSAGTGAFGHAAALAQHGLPVFGGRDDHVDYFVGAGCTRHNAGNVRRHHDPLPEEDVVVVQGIRVTTLERTIYDISRLGSLEAALVAFDAALRRVAWIDATNEYDLAAAAAFRQGVQRRIAAHSGARGIRQARFVAEFADGRAQLPGETLTRLRMWQLCLPAPTLQHRVELGSGRYALLDLALADRQRWLEFDGAIKYTDADMLAGRSVEAVRADQDARQAAVERTTGWRCDRATWQDVRTLGAFEAFRQRIALYP